MQKGNSIFFFQNNKCLLKKLYNFIFLQKKEMIINQSLRMHIFRTITRFDTNKMTNIVMTH